MQGLQQRSCRRESRLQRESRRTKAAEAGSPARTGKLYLRRDLAAMPHLIFQTRFPSTEQVSTAALLYQAPSRDANPNTRPPATPLAPAPVRPPLLSAPVLPQPFSCNLGQMAEISFFGSIERETMEALQHATCATLKEAAQKQQQASPAGEWRPSPHSGHAVHYVMNIPGDWTWRHTLQNILRVAWMDVFQRASWSLVSMWNANASASRASLKVATPPPPDHLPAHLAGTDTPSSGRQADTQNTDGAQRAATTAAVASVANGFRAAAGSTALDTNSKDGTRAGDSSAVAEFRGECTNFLLFKSVSGTAEAGGVRARMSKQTSTPSLDASLLFGGTGGVQSAAAAQQLVLASLPWLGVQQSTVDAGAGVARTTCNGGGAPSGATRGRTPTDFTKGHATTGLESSLLSAATREMNDIRSVRDVVPKGRLESNGAMTSRRSGKEGQSMPTTEETTGRGVVGNKRKSDGGARVGCPGSKKRKDVHGAHDSANTTEGANGAEDEEIEADDAVEA